MRQPSIGIRREDKNQWEVRAPLTPVQAAELVRRHGIRIIVQPYPRRAFKDEEYVAAGCEIREDLGDCNLVLGIKEMPAGFFRPGGVYAFFAHVIKGQPHNMGMLRRMMELSCSLIDYEKITDDSGRRLVFFGRFAGLAGMIDTLAALGRRLEFEGKKTPLGKVKGALAYKDLAEAKGELAETGREIREEGLPEDVVPLVIGVAGYGNVAKGVFEILDALGAEEIQPEELFGLASSASRKTVYRVTFREEHTVTPIQAGRVFNLQEYYQHPERYRSQFERFLPYLTVLVNCIYWEAKYPRLVTKSWLRQAYESGRKPKLMVIGDISCDIEGAIEATVKATNPGAPVFVYDPVTDIALDGIEGNGPVILAVDNLPCELPVDASQEFGRALLPFVPALAQTDFSLSLDQLGLPGELLRALILHRGRLTPDFEFIERFLHSDRKGAR
ncbi:MAG: bifunctional lysine ketoglutarate reductase /saccharopine dehydrogenase family protein [candidate division WOR-3 bacterium]